MKDLIFYKLQNLIELLRGHVSDDFRCEDTGNGSSSDQNCRLQSFHDLTLQQKKTG